MSAELDVGHDRAVEERVTRGRYVRSTNWSHRTKSPGLTWRWSEPAAHGEITALTPSERIAQTFAR